MFIRLTILFSAAAVALSALPASAASKLAPIPKTEAVSTAHSRWAPATPAISETTPRTRAQR